MSADDVRQAFLDQAKYCDALGSPFTARLCRLHAERLQPGHQVADHILGWPGNPAGSADSVPLRVAGSLHALVLEGRDSLLSIAYPPDQSDDDALWTAVTLAFEAHSGFVLERLTSPPQTNEVRRSGALLPGFLALGRMFGRPLVLSEVGASAGLNLQWDRYRYRLGDATWGDPDSPVLIAPEWRGNPAANAEPVVVDRAGCDLNPVEASDPSQRLRMLSYIWADQADRLARTRAALDLAAQHGLHVDKADAIDWLKVRLAAPVTGSTHVIFNTIAWQYLPKALQEEGEKLISEAGAKATQDTPLARLQLEGDGKPDGAALTLQVWPSGEKQEIGRADFHGRWVDWRGWKDAP
jgi:hypothetical protein